MQYSITNTSTVVSFIMYFTHNKLISKPQADSESQRVLKMMYVLQLGMLY